MVPAWTFVVVLVVLVAVVMAATRETYTPAQLNAKLNAMLRALPAQERNRLTLMFAAGKKITVTSGQAWPNFISRSGFGSAYNHVDISSVSAKISMVTAWMSLRKSTMANLYSHFRGEGTVVNLVNPHWFAAKIGVLFFVLGRARFNYMNAILLHKTRWKVWNIAVDNKRYFGA